MLSVEHKCWWTVQTPDSVEWRVESGVYSCSQEGGKTEGAISVSVGLWWPDWRLTAAADHHHDERLPSFLSGDQGLVSGPGTALPPAGQTRDNIFSLK